MSNWFKKSQFDPTVPNEDDFDFEAYDRQRANPPGRKWTVNLFVDLSIPDTGDLEADRREANSLIEIIMSEAKNAPEDIPILNWHVQETFFNPDEV